MSTSHFSTALGSDSVNRFDDIFDHRKVFRKGKYIRVIRFICNNWIAWVIPFESKCTFVWWEEKYMHKIYSICFNGFATFLHKMGKNGIQKGELNAKSVVEQEAKLS